AYGHDSFFTLVWTKSIVDTGWWITNGYLGAPYELDMRDFPANPTFHFLVLRFLSLFSSHPALLVNLYFVLTFPLTAVAGMAALRSMKLPYGLALLGGVLYAFLPYHFWRGESHLVLAGYYLVPLAIMVIVWVGRGEAFLLVRRGQTGRLGVEVKSG